MEKHKIKVVFNAPVILSFTGLCLVVLIVHLIFGNMELILGSRFTSWKDPMQYVRLFTHVITNNSLEHFSGNIMMILLIGPLVEEKYGSNILLIMILTTAAITGLVSVLFFKNIVLFGASGIVFMLIILASVSNMQEGSIPVTAILVAVLYLGIEVVTGITGKDNISQISHVIGGLCGAAFGFVFRKLKRFV